MLDLKTIVTLAIGVALVGAGYLAYIAATKGVPAAWAKLQSWWNAAKADAAKVKGDLAARRPRGIVLGRKVCAPVAA